MSQPAVPLKKAIRAALVIDATLLALLGGPRVHDEVPRSAVAPYIVFGDLQTRDFSSVGSRSHETRVSLSVLSNQGGTREAHVIAAQIETILHEAALVLDGHRLVNLMLETSEARRERNTEATRITLRFRAFTELL